MAEQENNEFRDPVLKQAVCRCWAGECASVALRKRVAALFEEQSPASSQMNSGRRNPFAWTIWPTALAALLLISFGVFNHFRTPGQTAVALPVDLEYNLIQTHDHCCRMANHQGISVPIGDDAAIVKRLNQRLNQPVVMFHPTDTAWVFRGASVCPVGGTPSGHLVFAKGNGALSVFSLPNLPKAADGSQYADIVNQHCIVGFVKDGALFCMVSSGPADALSVEQLKKMEAEMQPTKLAAAPAPPTDGVLLTELLQPLPR